jgi:hypothetical protein
MQANQSNHPSYAVLALAIGLVAVAIVALLAEPLYFEANPKLVTTTTTSMFSTTSSWTTTTTTTSTWSTTSTTTQQTSYSPYYSPYFNVNNPACQYPLNPYVCNEGQPVSIVGSFYNDSSCLTVYGSVMSQGTVSPQPQAFVLWFYPSAPTTIPFGSTVQVYGYIYPDWPQGYPFPPYPFQSAICVGIPMASIPPYYQTGA